MVSMSQSIPVHPLLFLVVFGVSGAIGLFLGGAFGAAIFGVVGLVVFAATLNDVNQTNDS